MAAKRRKVNGRYTAGPVPKPSPSPPSRVPLKSGQRRTPEQRAADLVQIAELTVRGHSTAAITRLMNGAMSRETVRVEVKRLNDEWRAMAAARISDNRARAIARLEWVAREAADAWVRSQKDREKQRLIEKEQPPARRNGKTLKAPPLTEKTIERTGQVGDPRFLAEVREATVSIAQILGIRMEPRDDDGDEGDTDTTAIARELLEVFKNASAIPAAAKKEEPEPQEN